MRLLLYLFVFITLVASTLAGVFTFHPVNQCNEKAYVTGQCHLTELRYTYNLELNACSLFVYGGCDGTNNNFKSREECEEICKLDKTKRKDKFCLKHNCVE